MTKPRKNAEKKKDFLKNKYKKSKHTHTHTEKLWLFFYYSRFMFHIPVAEFYEVIFPQCSLINMI